MNPEYFYKVIIVGAGPAGISCAIQLKRSGIVPVVFEKHEPGGMLQYANLVENYPGFPGGISGKKLASLMLGQFKSEVITLLRREVIKISFSKGLFYVETDGGLYSCEIAVIATGTKPVLLSDTEISSEAEKMVLYHASDFAKLKNKNIIIVGSGDLAFDYALTLNKFNNIEILCRSAKPKCISLLLDKFKHSAQCSFSSNTRVISVSVDGSVLKVLCRVNGRKYYKSADFLIISIGRVPDTDFITSELLTKLNEFNKLKNFFIIGDAFNDNFRQAAIAAGDGVKTAMVINEILNKA
jgi:thioredoxin reductase (NADPH)